MLRWFLWSVLLLPQAAVASPATVVVTKGPVITAVTQSEAWVAWETSVEEGVGEPCQRKGPIASLSLTHAKASVRRVQDRACSRVHHVHLTQLQPDTAYSFTLDRPVDGGAPALGHFTTAPAKADTPFSFVVYGDNREPPEGQPQTKEDHEAVTSAILKREPKAAFLIHTGDLALNQAKASGPDRGYAEFFDVERAILASRPIFAVVGNHETLDMDEYDTLVNAGSYTHVPHPYFYSVDWGAAHFALLDAFEGPSRDASHGGGRDPGFSDEQLRWLDADLAAARKAGRTIFVVAHQGPYSHFAAGAKGHGGSVEAQERVVPLLRQYGVTAIFAGHDHYYQRGQEGCVNYFVVGSGGAPMYEPDKNAPGVKASAKVISYLVVTVDGHRVSAVAKNVAGETIDSTALAPAPLPGCSVGAAGQAPGQTTH